MTATPPEGRPDAPGTGAGAPASGIGTGDGPQGVRVLVTRPGAQAEEAVRELQAAGLAAEALPLIDIVADPGADAALAAAWARLAQIDFVMFVSAAAVARFFAPVAPSAHDPDAAPVRAWPAATRAGATGPGTVAALRRAGVPQACIDAPAPTAAQFDSEALWAGIGARDWRGRAALIVRGEGGRDWLADTLRTAGAAVEAISLYRRDIPRWSGTQWAACERAWAQPQAHWWHLSSSQAIDHLVAMVAARHDRPAPPWARLQALASHPRIARHAREAGFGTVREVAPGMAAVIEALRPASRTDRAG